MTWQRCLNLLLGLSFMSSSCKHGIRIMGLDNSGERSIQVDHHQYEHQIGETLAEAHDAAIEAFDAMPDQGVEFEWGIDYIMVGLGLEGEIGIPGVTTIRAFPRFRLYFTRPIGEPNENAAIDHAAIN